MTTALSSQISTFMFLYTVAMVIVTLGCIGYFVHKALAFKKAMQEVLAGLGDGSQFQRFTPETGEGLQRLFSGVPALAFSFQNYFQSLIPPQPPYEPYFKSGREAAFSFDREFILRTSLGLKVFQALPAVLIAMGALGSLIGLGASISSTQALIESSSNQGLADLAQSLFAVGAKTFWPAVVGLFGGVSAIITEKMLTAQASDMIQALTMTLDSGMSPKTIEQIASTSLTELRQTHKTLSEFTSNYAQTMQATVAKLITRSGNLTVDELLEQKAQGYIAPLQSEIETFRSESGLNIEAIREMIEIVSQKIGEDPQTQSGTPGSTSLSAMLRQVCMRIEESTRQIDANRSDLRTKLDWLRDELQSMHLAGMQNGEVNLNRLLETLHRAQETLFTEIRGVRDSASLGLGFGPLGAIAGDLSDEAKAELASRIASQFGAQAEITQTLLTELRDSSQIIASDLHVATKIIEESLAKDLTKQSELLVAINDRIGMGNNRMVETVLSVGEDIAHRVDLVSTVLVGDAPAENEGEHSPFLNEVRNRISQYSPEVTYAEMRNNLAQLNIDKRMKEGEDRRMTERAVRNAEQINEERKIVRTNMFARMQEIQQQVIGQASGLSKNVAQQGENLRQQILGQGETLGEKLQNHSSILEDQILQTGSALRSEIQNGGASLKSDLQNELNASANKLTGGVNLAAGDINSTVAALIERLESRLDSIGKRMDRKIADIGSRVNEELGAIAEEVDAISQYMNNDRLEEMAEDIQDINNQLGEIPLSTIKVVKLGSRREPSGPQSRRLSRRRERDLPIYRRRIDSARDSDFEDELQDHEMQRPVRRRRAVSPAPRASRRRNRRVS